MIPKKEELRIKPTIWNGRKKIEATINWVRSIESTSNPAILICFNLGWDGTHGGNISGVVVPIILKEDNPLQTQTFQLVVRGSNLIDPEIGLRPCKSGTPLDKIWKARPIKEDTGIGCLSVLHDRDRLKINLKNCPRSSDICIERKRNNNGDNTLHLFIPSNYRIVRHKLTPKTARALGKALLFAAKQQE